MILEAGRGLFEYGRSNHTDNWNRIKYICTERYFLHHNFPNPFNPVTSIRYELHATEHVVIKLYNLLDQEIVKLVDKKQEAGYHSIQWDASNQASGIYILLINAGPYHKNMKIFLLK